MWMSGHMRLCDTEGMLGLLLGSSLFQGWAEKKPISGSVRNLPTSGVCQPLYEMGEAGVGGGS